MAVKLNLLPSDYAVTGPVASLLKVVRPLNVTLLAIFLASALGMAGFFIFSSISLNNLNSVNDSLKSQIQTQQTAQQQVVLLKDRLGKIRAVQAIPGASKNLLNAGVFVNSIGDSSYLTELNADPQKVSLSVGFKTNGGLTSFVHDITTQSKFSSVTVDSFSFNPINGYTVGFLMTGN